MWGLPCWPVLVLLLLCPHWAGVPPSILPRQLLTCCTPGWSLLPFYRPVFTPGERTAKEVLSPSWGTVRNSSSRWDHLPMCKGELSSYCMSPFPQVKSRLREPLFQWSNTLTHYYSTCYLIAADECWVFLLLNYCCLGYVSWKQTWRQGRVWSEVVLGGEEGSFSLILQGNWGVGHPPTRVQGFLRGRFPWHSLVLVDRQISSSRAVLQEERQVGPRETKTPWRWKGQAGIQRRPAILLGGVHQAISAEHSSSFLSLIGLFIPQLLFSVLHSGSFYNLGSFLRSANA